MKDGEEKKTAVGTVEEVLPNSLFRVRLSTMVEEGEEVSSEVQAEEVSDKPVAGQRLPIDQANGQGELVLAYLAGKMRLHRIRVLVGDQVDMILDPYGGRARIVRRLT